MKTFKAHHLSNLLIILGLFLNLTVAAQSEWSLELQSGATSNIPLPLVIRQTGMDDYSFTAHYKSEPFHTPLYYEYRISRWENKKSWELEFIHHKIYLTNPNQDVEKFSISHGFNMLSLNRGIDFSGNIFRAGLGLVIAHPEFTIRGISFDQKKGWFNGGYVPAGFAVNFGYGRHLNITDRFFLNLELKTTIAYARLTQDDPGTLEPKDLSVDTYNWAFHLIIGPGYTFLKTRR